MKIIVMNAKKLPLRNGFMFMLPQVERAQRVFSSFSAINQILNERCFKQYAEFKFNSIGCHNEKVRYLFNDIQKGGIINIVSLQARVLEIQ